MNRIQDVVKTFASLLRAINFVALRLCVRFVLTDGRPRQGEALQCGCLSKL